MIRHVVMWRLTPQGEQREQAAAKIKGGLEALVGVVPGLTAAQVGRNLTPGGFDLCLACELADRAALEAYQVHPAHVKMKEYIHTVVSERACCDWEA